MKKTIQTILLAAAAAGIFITGHKCSGRNGRNADGGGKASGGFGYAEVRVDTVFVRDTLRDTVLVPKERLIVRVDTVWLAPPGDTTRQKITLPIERQTYATPNYRAVIEGFRPKLIELELYRATPTVTRTITLHPTPKKWSVGLQVGYGITPKGPAPYLGVGIQYRLLEW
jgi:hypothetical protein